MDINLAISLHPCPSLSLSPNKNTNMSANRYSCIVAVASYTYRSCVARASKERCQKKALRAMLFTCMKTMGYLLVHTRPDRFVAKDVQNISDLTNKCENTSYRHWHGIICWFSKCLAFGNLIHDMNGMEWYDMTRHDTSLYDTKPYDMMWP